MAQPPDDPQWYKDAVIYELHVRAFFDSNNDGKGDFPGLTSRLDYLQDLGITCIWLLPFYPSPLKDDGYDIQDYHQVHPDYGTIDDFKIFLEAAHARGLKVVTELVINHTSDQHPWFQAARSAPKGSPKRDFYVWSDSEELYKDARIIFIDTEKSNWTWDPVAGQYYWHRFFSHQPDLNYDNPHVLRAVVKIMEYWFDMGVDGMRLDAIPYLIERDGTNCENLPETHAVLKELRRNLDAKYTGKFFLAEANQWPDDVRPYFGDGDGDECHMAYHFPVMPRLFMALRQEDRTPIVEIMDRTPDIPENSQWAMFLRNHDELTLEMVTNEERDYMYNEYAADPMARINLGIRRRLAPLVGYSRRRLELLNSLLLSFPGTPVLYYGDEIGMGDNIYLRDRNGVRTPMQWSADRNAGFSRADFAQLYAPPIVDNAAGYLAVNVEGQERDPSSLLHFNRRMLALRKRYKAFGRGTIEFLPLSNNKVLAYVRRYQDDVILCVANLSRFVQPAELDLSAFWGMTPVELMGDTEFPRIGDLPYFLALGPHAFYWFRLRKSASPWTLDAGSAPGDLAEEMPAIALDGGWDTLLRGKARRALEGQALGPFLKRQRWFSGKSREIRQVRVTDATRPREVPNQARLLLVEVIHADGGSDTYFLPVAFATDPAAKHALYEQAPNSIIAEVTTAEGIGLLHDALVSDDFCRWLLSLMERRREAGTVAGRFKGEHNKSLAEFHGDPSAHLPVVRSGAEQSNTSVAFGDRLILKLVRRLDPGENPELEIGRFLTQRTPFNNAPKTLGAIEYRRPDSEPVTIGILQNLVPFQAVGWEHALDELGRYYETVRGLPEFQVTPETDGVVDLSRRQVPQNVLDTVGVSLSAAETLGRRTAELHLALSSHDDDPDFAPEPLTGQDLAAQAASTREQVARILGLLEGAMDKLPEPTRLLASAVLAGRDRLLAPLDHPVEPSGGLRIRCHGDYHLGQVLWSMSDFILLDFEGEPLKPLAERRKKHSPVKDVVGMLRSYNYAAFASLFRETEGRPGDLDRLLPAARSWSAWTGARFLAAYREQLAGSPLLPANMAELDGLICLYLLDKATYELEYELSQRPDWVRIPLQAIADLAGISVPPAD